MMTNSKNSKKQKKNNEALLSPDQLLAIAEKAAAKYAEQSKVTIDFHMSFCCFLISVCYLHESSNSIKA